MASALTVAAGALPTRASFQGRALRKPNGQRAPARTGACRRATRAAIADPPAGLETGSASDAIPATVGTGRKKVVVLGSGWGAISFVKSLQSSSPYDVVLISPRNYFLYTPLLPGAATGAVEERSIVEPIRRPIAAKGYKYYEAACVDVNARAKTVTCRAADASFDKPGGDQSKEAWQTFDVAYDYLVTSVGAVPNTFGVPGVQENCMFFKEIVHATKFRYEVNERFERATLPNVPDETLKQLLSFVVIGAGPTGVELAAELYDMVNEDIARLYPRRLLPFVSIKIIDLQEKILSAYDRRIAEYATDFFQRAKIECLLGKGVNEVRTDVVVLTDNKTKEVVEVPFGIAVWCTGTKLNPLCEKIMAALPAGAQTNQRSLTTDKTLRVKGSSGTIFALGDCATIERPRSMNKAMDLYRFAAKFDSNGVCNLDLGTMDVDDVCYLDLGIAEIKGALSRGVEEFPHLEEVINNIDDKFAAYANPDTGKCSFEGFQKMLTEVDNGLRALPATAQVAKQEGEFLADFFIGCDGDAEALAGDASKFDYVHKGSLAYIGKNAAVADIPGFTIVKGFAAGIIWKGFETISQVSIRNIFLVAADMVRTKIFGRDISRFNN